MRVQGQIEGPGDSEELIASLPCCICPILNAYRRLNVAITRAKSHTFIFGDINDLAAEDIGGVSGWDEGRRVRKN